MPDFTYTVTVSAATEAQADQVMAERVNYDEEYDIPELGGYIEYGISFQKA